ncbi:uncharacterized protein LOC133185372 [Saccostrea echinata]|uniref:uncharacterized protein LOC133185372 n=1 Tax=Saccostrea echinata TaxID=191078 RepID=UPI002A81E1FC|nr:uncharacterized protein LOC133185372 [Saccostrea echinata]
MASNGLENKEKLRRTHLCFGNDPREKTSSYRRDYGPDSRFPVPLPPIMRHSETPVEVLPVTDFSTESRFLTSNNQYFNLYNKNISDTIRQCCLRDFNINKALHGGRGVINYQEKLTPLTRSKIDYRLVKHETGPNSQNIIRKIKEKSKPVKLNNFESADVSEAMQAYQWPLGHQLPPWIHRRIGAK